MFPLYHARHNWSDRSKSVDLPLFPGYVFCRLEVERRFPILTIPGVVHVVEIGNVPVPIDDAEIETIQNAIKADLKIEPWPFLESGERVRLNNGPLDGREGFLVNNPEPRRLVVSVAVLERSVAVEFDHTWLAPSTMNGGERHIS